MPTFFQTLHSATPTEFTAVAAFSAELAAGADAAPEWVHLLPAGTFGGRDGRGPYRVADPAAVIAATQGLGMDLPLDRDHATDYAAPGTPVPAAGWIKGLEWRDSGLWGRVDWTATAAGQVQAKEYRYLSPVFDHAKDGTVLRVRRAALTNNPNLFLTSLNSQEQASMSEFLAQIRAALGLDAAADGAAVVAHASGLMARVGQLDQVAVAVGLPAGADVAAITAQASALKTRADAPPDPAKFVPIDQFTAVSTQLADAQKSLNAGAVETAVNAAVAAGKVVPATHAWAKSFAEKDLAGFQAWATVAPVVVPPGTATHAGPKPPAGNGGPTDAELAICRQLGISPDELAKHKEPAE